MRFLSDILAKAGLTVDGITTLNTVSNATVDTDKFLVVDSSVVKYRTGAELLSDIGAVPTSRTLTINGVTYDLSANRSWELNTGGTTVRYNESFVATSNQTVFTTTNTLTAGYFDVYLNGVKLDSGSYSATSNTITLVDGAVAGNILEVVILGNLSVAATLPSQTGHGGKFLTTDGVNLSWVNAVTSVSVVTANGFAGTVATSTTTPAITLTTTITGILKGNGTAISAAVANTDYQSPISLTTTGNSGAATFNGTTLNIPNYTLAGLGGLTNPMTTLGDIIYGGASGAPTRLAGNTTTAKQYLSQTGNGSASAAPTWSAIAGDDVTGAALTKTDDTNVTLTLGGSASTSLLRAASLTLGWTGQLAVSRGGTGAGTLTGVLIGNGTSAVTAITGTASQYLRRNSGNTAYEFAALTAADVTSGAALTKVDDTNVTLTLGGTPASSLLTAVSLTLGWTGQLAVGRGGTGTNTLTGVVVGNGTSAFTAVAGTASQYLRRNSGNTAYEFGAIAGSDVTGAALTKTDDTNVTLTLGGTPATALLRAASITVGWTGQLAVSRGGTGAGTLTGVVLGNGTSAMTAVSSTTPLQVFRVNAAGNGYEFATVSTSGGGYTTTAVSAATHNETATSGEVVLIVDTTSNSVTINLPTAVGNTAKITIKRISGGTNTITVDGSGAETIDGGATAVMRRQYEAITLISNGANWFII